MKTAYLYIRVSTDEQADKGYSQRHQDEILTRYCLINGIMIKAKFFEDHSAKSFQRPEFSKLLMTLKKHKGIVDLILFTKWDRFSRNAADAYAMIGTLNKLRAEPQAVEQPLDLEIPENKMMLAFYLAVPEVENDRRALNTFSGMRRAQKEGRWVASAPIGYSNKVSEDGKKYIAPNKDAVILKWLFEQVSTGKFTTDSLIRLAREKGLKRQKNALWTALRNPVYCGMIRIKAFKNEEEQIVKGQHEPIISEALFYQVQDVLDGKKKVMRAKVTVDDRFPLRGFLICPDCGRLLTASASKGKSKYYSYYHCTGGCKSRFSATKVDDCFRQEIGKWKPHAAVQVLYKVVLAEMREKGEAERRKEIKSIQAEISRLTDRKKKALELRLSNDLETDDYLVVKRECEEGIIKLELKLSEVAAVPSDVEPQMDTAFQVLSQIDKLYEQSSTNQKREIVSSIYPEKLTFTGDYFRTPIINEAVQLIYNLGAGLQEKERIQIGKIAVLDPQVAPTGIEPVSKV